VSDRSHTKLSPLENKVVVGLPRDHPHARRALLYTYALSYLVASIVVTILLVTVYQLSLSRNTDRASGGVHRGKQGAALWLGLEIRRSRVQDSL